MIPSIHSLLRKYRVAPRKRLGQHFLSAMPTVEKIVASFECTKDDTVIEIGPGLGVMTALLAQRARRVIAIDRDPRLLDIARTEFGSATNIEWINADILELDLHKIAAHFPAHAKMKVIGNLPYNISSPILFLLLDHRALISRAIVMIQKEVAIRIVARPGGKDYGILSVLLQAHATCKKLFDVSAKSFIPPPEVTSSVLCIDFKEGPCGIDNEDKFRKLVKAAFGKRRKTLRNALLRARDLSIAPESLDLALRTCAIDGKRRPETLSVEEFAAIANYMEANHE